MKSNEARLNLVSLELRLDRIELQLAEIKGTLLAVSDKLKSRDVTTLMRELEGYRRALVAHHDLATLSDEVIAEYDFRECPVCRRARES